MNLRSATLEDLPKLLDWDTRPHVIEAGGNWSDHFDWEHELPRVLPWRELLIAEVNKRPIGFLQIIDPELEESHYWGDAGSNLRAIDIWIGEKTDLGKGYGTQMMCAAFDRCFNDTQVRAILIDPLARNVRAHRLYERLGFEFVERRIFGSDSCLVYRLDRDKWQNSLL